MKDLAAKLQALERMHGCHCSCHHMRRLLMAGLGTFELISSAFRNPQGETEQAMAPGARIQIDTSVACLSAPINF